MHQQNQAGGRNAVAAGKLMNALHEMLADIESHRLHVILVPLNPGLRNYCEGGMKRCVADKNPHWYSRLCYNNPSSRGTRRGGPDTRVRRQNILRILRRLSSGLPSRSKYVPELMQIARRAA